MLKILVGSEQFFNDNTEEFTTQGGTTIELEHSLVAMSKWESKFERAFLSPGNKSDEETFAYIECMNLTPEIPPEVFRNLSEENLEAIKEYLEAKQSATWFQDEKAPATQNQEVVTAELIYYWMSSFNIPWEAQHWHLNRLFTLIKVFNVKNAKPKKMSRAEMASRNRSLNEQRRKELGTSG